MLLYELKNSIGDDKAVLDGWGNLCAERGDFPLAEEAFRHVLELALSNLGTLRAKQGNLAESAHLLRRLLRIAATSQALAMNLARVECAQGDPHAAQTTLQTALVYNPNLDDLRRLNDLIREKPEDCSAGANKPECAKSDANSDC